MAQVLEPVQWDAESLTRLRFFTGESPDAIEWLLDACSRRRLDAGETLLEPGQSNDELFVILQGELAVKLARDGDNISTLLPGDCAGEMSLLDSTHTSAWVISKTPCELLVLEADHLWSVLTHSHLVSLNLLCILSERVRSDNRLIDKSQQLKSFYEYHARVDALTGLNNRRWLDATMARLARRGHAHAEAVSIIMLDIDSFKPYNDTHGHINGDGALRAVAQVIRDNIRPSDLAARYGGEEFVLLLPNTELSRAMDIATRLVEATRRARIADSRGCALPGVTVSAGVASGQPSAHPHALLELADAALYRAKRNGRNRASL